MLGSTPDQTKETYRVLAVGQVVALKEDSVLVLPSTSPSSPPSAPAAFKEAALNWSEAWPSRTTSEVSPRLLPHLLRSASGLGARVLEADATQALQLVISGLQDLLGLQLRIEEVARLRRLAGRGLDDVEVNVVEVPEKSGLQRRVERQTSGPVGLDVADGDEAAVHEFQGRILHVEVGGVVRAIGDGSVLPQLSQGLFALRRWEQLSRGKEKEK